MKTPARILLAAIVALLGSSGSARAQDTTSGAVRGAVTDQQDGTVVVGATVVASGSALQGTQATITDETGQYFLSNLPPGVYQVVVYYADAQFARTNVLVQLGKVGVVNIRIDTKVAAGETIVIQGRAPLIDQQSTKLGRTLTEDYTRNLPTGRTFTGTIEAAGTSQSDFYGTSIAGSTSVENTYIVEGVNVTDPGKAFLATDLPNEFIQETEIITGGYNAEFGRSTGGIINVITKSGSNEFHGSVFGTWTPGALAADERSIPRAGNSIERSENLANAVDLGAEVGGPIVKDRLWFHAGLNPSFAQDDVARIIKTQVDRDGDGLADVDAHGYPILEEVDRTTTEETSQQYFYSAKLTGAYSPDHQGSLSLIGSPSVNRDYCPFGLCSNTGIESANKQVVRRNVLDGASKWTSKFNESRTEVEAIAGYHRDASDMDAGIEQAGTGNRIEWRTERPLMDFAGFEQAYGGVPHECNDSAADDPYPGITNCPVSNYAIGGVGEVEDSTAQRLSAQLSLTQRVQAAGHHVFKIGADVEQQSFDVAHHYSGGTLYEQEADTTWVLVRFDTPDDDGDLMCGVDLDGDGATEANCSHLTGNDDLAADTTTRNLSAYAQDSWSILPNLTVNAGLRWEQQNLYNADQIRGVTSPVSGEQIGDEAFSLKNLLAPRVGATYDWTGEGRSKVYGHYGRFYESVPMDINIRAYGGEIINVAVIHPDACNVDDPVNTCDEQAGYLGGILLGAGETLNSAGLGGQYLDEIVLGSEYELLPDLKVGAAYIRRDLGRAIEDVSTDGGLTYIIANPGDADDGAIADLRKQAMNETDPSRRAFLQYKADSFESVKLFDRPKRTYDALQLTAERRFTDRLMVGASYTYSKLRGNYPGLFSPETTQLDPNVTSMYDLPELMANRYGDLSADRPHNIKVDAFYVLPVEKVGWFTLGGRARAISGMPINTLANHPVYGVDESYVLERGEAGRTGMTTRFDTHLAYGRNLSDGMRLEAFLDIFNVFNQQPETKVSESYTYESMNPIVGGDAEDLAHAKAFGLDGLPSNRAPLKDPNYKNTLERQAPLSARIGLRLTF